MVYLHDFLSINFLSNSTQLQCLFGMSAVPPSISIPTTTSAFLCPHPYVTQPPPLSLSLSLSLRFFLHSSIVLFSPLKATNHLIIVYYLLKRESP